MTYYNPVTILGCYNGLQTSIQLQPDNGPDRLQPETIS